MGECFSLFHATLLEGDRAAHGRSLFVAKKNSIFVFCMRLASTPRIITIAVDCWVERVFPSSSRLLSRVPSVLFSTFECRAWPRELHVQISFHSIFSCICTNIFSRQSTFYESCTDLVAKPSCSVGILSAHFSIPIFSRSSRSEMYFMLRQK